MAVGCSPLQRGASGDGIASTAQPDVLITVPSMPVVVNGAAMPLLYTDTGYDAPQVWYQLNAPEGKANKVQAVTILAETPTNWEWDLNLSASPKEVDVRMVSLGDHNFTAATYALPSVDDAFTPLVVEKDGSVPETWLVRRFTRLDYFRTIKILLEYREPMPAMFAKGFTLLNPEEIAALQAFGARAEKAFHVQFDLTTIEPVSSVYDVANVKTMEFTNILGTMSPKAQPLDVDIR